jgi:hypothetical protein
MNDLKKEVDSCRNQRDRERRHNMEELRQEITQIRDEMDHTIEAIQERVSPQRVMEQARDAV